MANGCQTRWGLVVYGIIWGLVLPAMLLESAWAGPISKATSSSAARQASLQGLPLKRLTPEAQDKILQVVENPSIFRRMPVTQFECDAQLYRFLVRNPEVVVNIWQIMGISRVTLKRTDQYLFDAADGMGTSATVELVYGDQTTHIFYGEGNYTGPLLPRTFTGRCVLVLTSAPAILPSGDPQITSSLDVFLQVDQLGAEMLTRTLQPLVGRSADRNFLETSEFLGRMWRTAAENGPGMQRLAARLTDVSPAQRQQLAHLSGLIYSQQLPAAATPAMVGVTDQAEAVPYSPQLRR